VFMACGRFKVMMPMCSSFSTRTASFSLITTLLS
jgi:hypothetical protein